MSLKQAHYVLNRLIEEVNFNNAIEADSLSQTHSQLSITHISALHFTLVLYNCLIPQCSQLTDFSHALHAILSVLTTYGRLWSQSIFSAMQMLCTDNMYRERRRCWELNVIEAGSLSWTGRQHHCNDLHLNLIQILILSLFWGGRGSGSGSVSTELRVLVLGQTLNR